MPDIEEKVRGRYFPMQAPDMLLGCRKLMEYIRAGRTVVSIDLRKYLTCSTRFVYIAPRQLPEILACNNICHIHASARAHIHGGFRSSSLIDAVV